MMLSPQEPLIPSGDLSRNEELLAINSQLVARATELQNDLQQHDRPVAANVAVSRSRCGVSDRELTPPASALLNLCDSDVGRPWAAVARGFDEQLAIDSQLTIETRMPIEKNVQTHDRKSFLRRVIGYRAEGARVGGVAATFVDITEQIESDAQQRRFAAMLRDSADAIFVMDFDGRIVAWNRGAQRLYGYTQSEALMLNVRDLMTGDQLDLPLGTMRRVARGQTMPAFDTQRRTRDGRLADVSATIALLFDAAGNPESLASTERDITARRRAEDETRMLNVRLEQKVAERATELQHSEEQIRAILDATADAVVTIDVLGRIATFNRAAERIFGYTANEVIGESVTLLMPPEERFGRYSYKATLHARMLPASSAAITRSRVGARMAASSPSNSASIRWRAAICSWGWRVT